MKFTNNKRFFTNILAIALGVYGLSILPSVCVAAYNNDSRILITLLSTSLICLIAGEGLHAIVRRDVKPVKPRAWYITVLFTWFFFIFISSITFYIGMPDISVIDSIVEATASITGTGASTRDVSSLPRAIQLWRATLNWMGSIGIIMTTLSILPTWQFLGRGIALTEFPGPTFLKTNSVFYKGYRKLVGLYICLTIADFLLLIIAGMPLMDSLLTALSNTSTSGLLHFKNGDITGMSMPIKIIITVFALLGSVNANLIFLVFRKKIHAILKNSELRFYTSRIALTTAVIAVIIIASGYMNVGSAIGDSLMQTISYTSTSGYTVADSSKWPDICRQIIIIQLFIGACAMSTGGGIKISRVIIMLKNVSFSIYRQIHPRSVRSLMLNNEPLTGDQIVRANIYVSLFMTTFIVGAFMLSWDNLSLSDALLYSQAFLTNTGASIGNLTTAISDFSVFDKLIMCILMLAGRLEIYPLIMLFMPSLWQADNTR